MSITVTERGRAAAPADQAVLDLQVQVRRPSVAEALDSLAAIVQVVFDVVANGPASEHATANLGVSVDHDRHGQPIGHQANQQVRVVVPLDHAGQVIGDVVTAAGDAITVRGLSQRASDREALVRAARADAVMRARAGAHHLADLAGCRLGGLVEVVEADDVAATPRPTGRMMMASAADPVPVAAGTDEATTTVTATWAIDRTVAEGSPSSAATP